MWFRTGAASGLTWAIPKRNNYRIERMVIMTYNRAHFHSHRGGARECSNLLNYSHLPKILPDASPLIGLQVIDVPAATNSDQLSSIPGEEATLKLGKFPVTNDQKRTAIRRRTRARGRDGAWHDVGEHALFVQYVPRWRTICKTTLEIMRFVQNIPNNWILAQR